MQPCSARPLTTGRTPVPVPGAHGAETSGRGLHEPIGIYSQITDGRMKVWGISRPGNVTRQISLEGEVTDKGLEMLAQQAGRGLM